MQAQFVHRADALSMPSFLDQRHTVHDPFAENNLLCKIAECVADTDNNMTGCPAPRCLQVRLTPIHPLSAPAPLLLAAGMGNLFMAPSREGVLMQQWAAADTQLKVGTGKLQLRGRVMSQIM